MQRKLITSPLTVAPVMVAVVVVVAVCVCVSAFVVRSFAAHAQPFVAVRPVVMTTAHVPVVPEW